MVLHTTPHGLSGGTTQLSWRRVSSGGSQYGPSLSRQIVRQNKHDSSNQRPFRTFESAFGSSRRARDLASTSVWTLKTERVVCAKKCEKLLHKKKRKKNREKIDEQVVMVKKGHASLGCGYRWCFAFLKLSPFLRSSMAQR